MQANIVAVTQGVGRLAGKTAEEIIMYCARVSNPGRQNNTDTRLLRYCWDHGHVSIFEQADMTAEITTSRAISAQMMRHWSHRHQEFSQRYAEVTRLEPIELRRQDEKNRQNSIDDLPEDVRLGFLWEITKLQSDTLALYQIMLEAGVAKECARMILPMNTQTTLYKKANIRDWIMYLLHRGTVETGTQKEHRDIVNTLIPQFRDHFPIISEALDLKC